jgi:hypothetical protein
MAEWSIAHAWKACVGETLPWVRIPLSPPPAYARAQSSASYGVVSRRSRVAAKARQPVPKIVPHTPPPAHPSLKPTMQRLNEAVSKRQLTGPEARPSVLLEHGTFLLRVLHGGRVGGESPARIELTAAQPSAFGAEFAPMRISQSTRSVPFVGSGVFASSAIGAIMTTQWIAWQRASGLW